LETVAKKLYEAMFLVDSQQAADWDEINKTIKNILNRSEAEIVSIKKWDERKLAYEIRGQSRGTYILCYFRADGGKIKTIEKDVRLSERIMRVLILNAEAISQGDIERGLAPRKDASSAQSEKQGQQSPQQAEQQAEVGQEYTQELAEFADQKIEQKEESNS
jgi:small subunit ribosomal protein S6